MKQNTLSHYLIALNVYFIMSHFKNKCYFLFNFVLNHV